MVSGVIDTCTRRTGNPVGKRIERGHVLSLTSHLLGTILRIPTYAISSNIDAKKRRQPQHCAAEPSARFRGSSQATGSVGLPQDFQRESGKGSVLTFKSPPLPLTDVGTQCRKITGHTAAGTGGCAAWTHTPELKSVGSSQFPFQD